MLSCSAIRIEYVEQWATTNASDVAQIEQFIESIFPSQDPNAVILQSGKAGSDALANSGQNAAEREKQKKRDAEAKKDVMYMALASFGVMMTLAIVMVCLPFMRPRPYISGLPKPLQMRTRRL